MRWSGFYCSETLDASSGDFTVEQPMTALTGWPNNNQISCFAVYNQSGSGKVVRIIHLAVTPLSVGSTTAHYITLVPIDFAGTGEVLPVFKLDSTNANLPAQVEVLYLPNYINATTNTFRTTRLDSLASFTRALAHMASRNQGDSSKGSDAAEIIRFGTDANVQKFVLREGEGVALASGTNSPPVCAFMFTMSFKNQATGATYRVNKVIPPVYPNSIEGTGIVSLMNNSGSGVVLELSRIQLREIGTDEIPFITFEPIDGLHSVQGTTVPVLPMDSKSTLPSTVLVRRGSQTDKRGAKQGVILAAPAERRMVALDGGPFFPASTLGPLHRRHNSYGAALSMPRYCREGEGYALFFRNASSTYYYEATMHFEVTSAQETPAGTGVSYVS